VLDTDGVDEDGYRVSSFSGSGNCVAVARRIGGGFLVRHSRDGGPSIAFTAEEWRAFLDGVKAGEFDF
jgi:hypothetical protein